MNIKAVIFDLDGIIIDSEPWQKEAFNLTLKPYGIKLSDDEFKTLIGIRTFENFIHLQKKYNIPETPDNLTKIKNNLYKNILQKKIKPQPGLLNLLNYLNKKGYYLAVASGSIRHDVISTLDLLGITEFFQVIFTGDDVENGKPDPEIFIKTAKKLNIHPESCAVIEDSQTGVNAAKNAGMLVFAIPTSSTIDHNFTDAHKILTGLAELKKYL